MKLFLANSSLWRAAAIAAAVAIAGCSANGGVPAVSGVGAGATQSIHVQLINEGMAPDSCSIPSQFKVCVKPGGAYKLKLTLTCNSGSCGTVKWSTKMSYAQLKGTFKPNPGNPTTETISATKTAKVGHYTQTLTAKCSLAPSCVFHQKGQVWVIK
jgi:hypothetical protein